MFLNKSFGNIYKFFNWKRTIKINKRSISSTNISYAKRQLDVENIPDIKTFLSNTSISNENILENEVPPYLLHREREFFPKGKTVYIETYGCQMNVNDSEYAWTILKNSGYTKVDKADEADVVLLVTCSIREKAEQKIWGRLRSLKRLKYNHVTKQYPKIGVLGCMAERLKQKIVEKEKSVDVIAGPDAYRDLPRLLEEATQHSRTAINVMLSVDETYADVIPVRFDQQSKKAFVSVMRGCDNMCSYCIVPFTRGRERSRPIDSIVDEIRVLSEQGIRQVTLLGQNVNSYRDISTQSSDVINSTNLSKGFRTIYKTKQGGMRFADLLDKVSEVDPEMRIRFTSPHPKDFPDEVLQIMKERHNICKHIHLPAQSGSDVILERMRRGHTIEDYLRLVENIRSYMPDITFSTDMISGFCDETENDHQQTLDLMQKMKYNFAFLFKYSMRNKTHAYHRMQDSVDEATKQRRLAEVIDVYERCLPDANSKFVGDIQLVQIEKVSPKSDDHWLARTDGNLKCILPRSSLSVGSLCSDDVTQPGIGDYVAVKITEYHPNTFQSLPLFISTLADFQSNLKNLN